MLSMLLRTFRLAFKASLYKNQQELGVLLGVPVYQYKNALDIPVTSLNKIIDIINCAINSIKTGRCDAENIFILTIGNIFSVLYPSKIANNDF